MSTTASCRPPRAPFSTGRLSTPLEPPVPSWSSGLVSPPNQAAALSILSEGLALGPCRIGDASPQCENDASGARLDFMPEMRSFQV